MMKVEEDKVCQKIIWFLINGSPATTRRLTMVLRRNHRDLTEKEVRTRCYLMVSKGMIEDLHHFNNKAVWKVTDEYKREITEITDEVTTTD